jgi:hypothetical protein
VKVRLAGLVVLAALLFVIVPVRGPLPAHASHTFSPTLLWPDLHAAGDHTIGYATCPQSYPTTWLNGIEQSWDAILPAWDFYQVNGCNSNVILDWEGQFGSCEAPPPNGINKPTAVACFLWTDVPHGFHRDITSAKILFDVNHPQGHQFSSWGPNWQRAITAHEWGHVLGLADHLNPDGSEQDMCVINSIVGMADISRKATDNPCFTAPTSPDIGSVVCKVYGCHPNGAFVHTPSTVYVLQGNQKRHVLNSATWSDFSDVISITDDEAKAYLDGPDAGFRPGKLIASGGAVFLITNDGADWYLGQKRWVTSPSVLSQCFPNVTVWGPYDAGLVNRHTNGDPIYGCVPKHPNGTAVVVSGDAVWFIHATLRRWVISQAVQNSWFFGPDLVLISFAERNSYTQGSNIGFRPGRLIRKSSTGEIFFVTNEGEFGLATKRYVMNGTTLGCLFPGIPWIEASDFEADSHPTGTPIQIPAC